MAIKTAFHPS